MSLKCLYHNCDRVRYSRGLCASCYTRAWKRVKDGKTTWAREEAQGRALPQSASARKNWLHGFQIGKGNS